MSNNILDHEEVSEVTSRRARWLSPNAARPDSREESASGGEKSGGGGLGGAVASGIAGGVAHAIAGAVIDGALGSGGGGGSGRGRRGGDGDAPEPPPFLVNLYKRIQHKIDKENPLIQNRLSSLLTSETIYLGAMGAIFALICANQVRSEVEMLLKWILFSLSTWVVGHTWNAHRLVRAACVTIDRLYDDWDTEVRDKDKISGNRPRNFISVK